MSGGVNHSPSFTMTASNNKSLEKIIQVLRSKCATLSFPCFVLLTNHRLTHSYHTWTTKQLGVNSMSPTMRLVFPASRLAKTTHAGAPDYDITRTSLNVRHKARGVRARVAGNQHKPTSLNVSNTIRTYLGLGLGMPAR